MFSYSPCTSLKRLSDIVRLRFSTRTKFDGGFGGPGGDLNNNRSSGKPRLLLRLKKPPPGPPKAPPNLDRAQNPTRAIFDGSLYLSSGTILGRKQSPP